MEEIKFIDEFIRIMSMPQGWVSLVITALAIAVERLASYPIRRKWEAHKREMEVRRIVENETKEKLITVNERLDRHSRRISQINDEIIKISASTTDTRDDIQYLRGRIDDIWKKLSEKGG